MLASLLYRAFIFQGLAPSIVSFEPQSGITVSPNTQSLITNSYPPCYHKFFILWSDEAFFAADYAD